jgi:hypothetical protein
MRLKTGVKLAEITPQIVLAAIIVQEVYRERGGKTTITSANDGVHGTLSLHYKGNALDFRTKDFAGNKQALILEIKQRLGDQFDVLLEDEGKDNEHCHIEWEDR